MRAHFKRSPYLQRQGPIPTESILLDIGMREVPFWDAHHHMRIDQLTKPVMTAGTIEGLVEEELANGEYPELILSQGSAAWLVDREGKPPIYEILKPKCPFLGEQVLRF